MCSKTRQYKTYLLGNQNLFLINKQQETLQWVTPPVKETNTEKIYLLYVKKVLAIQITVLMHSENKHLRLVMN